MSTLSMISLPLDLRALRRWSAGRNLAIDEGCALHHLLSETFGKGILQPFRLMVTREARVGTLYAYTAQNQTALRETARETACPEALVVCDPARMAVKAMPDAWRTGRRLAFDIRVRPVRRLRQPVGDFKRKGAEVDAFLVETLRRFPDGLPEEAGVGLQRDQVYAQWFAERLGEAAHPEIIRMTRFERSRVLRHGSVLAEGPDVALQGELTVTDGEKFAEKLAKGVGRHTAYGYGMLLLRPAQRRA
ncbi:MAG: type I-E CRISPR-associated protein Cas6/Cse3/CasE [Magnetococcales bacterium]|nr:type I-E CRISPR-associated protein Cas6/Cse3/CasE [Magnetococcales bacterium]